LQTVKSLSKKFKAAEKGKETTKAAFEDLDELISDELHAQWEEEEELARDRTDGSLKIYEVRMEKGMLVLKSVNYHSLTKVQSSFIVGN
jgi:hypothetical protein